MTENSRKLNDLKIKIDEMMLDNIFFYEDNLKSNILFVSFVDLNVEHMVGSWEPSMACLTETFKIDLNTSIVVFSEDVEYENYCDKDCSCDNGYDYGDEESYVADSWFKIVNREHWVKLDEVNVDKVNSTTQSILSKIEEFMKKEGATNV